MDEDLGGVDELEELEELEESECVAGKRARGNETCETDEEEDVGLEIWPSEEEAIFLAGIPSPLGLFSTGRL